VAESLPVAVLAPGGQSGNFWIHRRIPIKYLISIVAIYEKLTNY